jgi:hypothetical protein
MKYRLCTATSQRRPALTTSGEHARERSSGPESFAVLGLEVAS